jgi:hypothetical protein
MWALSLVVLLAIATVAAIFAVRTSQRRAAYRSRRRRIEDLSLDEAIKRVEEVSADWRREENLEGIRTKPSPTLGPITARFVEQYAEFSSPNGTHRLGARYLATSRYRSDMLSIGTSDYLELCVRPGDDRVFVIDGSETDDELTDAYPSVFHLLVDYAEPSAGR